MTSRTVKRLAPASNNNVHGASISARVRGWSRVLAGVTLLLIFDFELPVSVQAKSTVASNPVVQLGSGTVSGLGTSNVTVNQSTQLLGINWNSLGNNHGEVLRFVQPSTSAIALNRVVGSDPSQFLGSLVANGSVIIINPNGVFFGPNSQVNVNGLIASSLNMTNANFVNGQYQFSGASSNGPVRNEGQISSGPFGVYLLAPNVTNNGVITSPGGSIALAAGTTAYLSDRADGRGFLVEVTAPAGEALNLKNLIADGGQVSMIGRLVTQSGVVQANSVMQQNGTIHLVASERVSLTAGSVTKATGDAQGISDGGTVRIVSDKSAGLTSFNSGAVVDVSGGTQGGNAGSVELSGAQLAMGGSMIGRAAPGYKGGNLLLDPTDLTVDTTYFQNVLTPFVQQGMTNLTVQADNNLTVSAVVNLTSGGGGTSLGWTLPAGQAGTLHFTAGNNLIFSNSTIVNGNVSQSASAGTSSTPWNYLFSAGNSILLNSAKLFTGGGGTLTMNATAGDINLAANGGVPSTVQTFNGNMILTAGGNVIAPSYFVSPQYTGIRLEGTGDLTIKTGLTTGGSFLGATVNNTVTGPGFVLTNGKADITINGGTFGTSNNYAQLTVGGLLPNGQLGQANVTVTATQNNIYIGSVQDRGLSDKIPGQPVAPMNTFNPNSSVSLTANQGSIFLQPPGNASLPPGLASNGSLPDGQSVATLRTVYPSSFSASAPNGNIIVQGNVQLWTSPVGSLSLLAGQSIQGQGPAAGLSLFCPLALACNPITAPGSQTISPITLTAVAGDISGLNIQFVDSYLKTVNISAGGNIRNVFGVFAVPDLGTDAAGNQLPSVSISAKGNIDFSGASGTNSGFLFGGNGLARVTVGGTLDLGTSNGLVFQFDPHFTGAAGANISPNQGGLLDVAVGKDLNMTQSRIISYNGASLFIHGLEAQTTMAGTTATATSATLGVITANGQTVLAIGGQPVLGPDGITPILVNGSNQALIGSSVYVVGGRAVLDHGGLPVVVGANDAVVGKPVLVVDGMAPLGLNGKPIVVDTTSSSTVSAGDLVHGTLVLDRPYVQLPDGTVLLVTNGKVVFSQPPGPVTIDGRPIVDSGAVTLKVGGQQVGVFNPLGGTVNVGTNRNSVDDNTGILTVRGGAIDLKATGDVNVNLSRVATLGGGDITLTSTTGDINAGKGARTDVTDFFIQQPDPTVPGQVQNILFRVPGSGIFTFSPQDGNLPNIPPFNPLSPFEEVVALKQFLGQDVSRLLPLVPAKHAAWANQYQQSVEQLFAGFHLGNIRLTAAHDVIVPPAGIRGRNITIDAGHNLELQGGEIRGITNVNVGSQLVGSLTGFIGVFAVNLGSVSGGTGGSTLNLGSISGNVGTITPGSSVMAAVATTSMTSSKAADDAKSSEPVGSAKTVADRSGKKSGQEAASASLRIKDRVRIKVETKPEPVK